MSKITKALEKAARERLERLRQRPTVTGQAVEVSYQTTMAATPSDIASPAGHLNIDPHIVVASDPRSPIAEQYRILRTNIQALRLRPGPKILVVTSAVHGEGKSVTALNLALSLARQERLRVALVDADLRKGSVQRWLGLRRNAEGLSAVLERGGALNGALLRLQSLPLAILPSGKYSMHPTELLESPATAQLFSALKAQFDLIVVDSPPVLPVADPGILAQRADGVLFVVRAGKTQRKVVAQAHNTLKQMKAPILGCVLTHVDYYLPGYYRYYHSYRYGVKEAEASNGKTASASAEGSSPQPTPLVDAPSVPTLSQE